MAALKEWGYPLTPVEELVIDPTADHPTGPVVHSGTDDEEHDPASEAEIVDCTDHGTENVEDEVA